MKQPIGVIDSGVGGLTVVHELMRQLPKEPLIYLGDTARCPYGPRTEEEVKQFTWEMVRFLLGKNIKMLVIACNTATAFTIKDLQKELDIPVIGVIKLVRGLQLSQLRITISGLLERRELYGAVHIATHFVKLNPILKLFL